MDPKRFDTLVQTLSRAATRRQVLAGLLAGVVAPLLPGLAAADSQSTTRRGRGQGGRHPGRGKGKRRRTDVRSTQHANSGTGKGDKPGCRTAGQTCEGNKTCCDGTSTICAASGPGSAKRCTPCPSGQIACNNVCIPACTASDQCHEAGACDPRTGACSNPPKADGVSCNADGDACTVGDHCDGGQCVAGEPKTCDVCQSCTEGTCQPVANDPNCANICCNGRCCPGVRACDAAGACATCKQTCPAGCDVCFNLIDGTTKCGTGFPGGASGTACEPCSSMADCGPGTIGPYCVVSQTVWETEFTRITAEGFCPAVPASIGGACFTVEDC